MKKIALNWLEQPTKYREGTTFGVPFYEGECDGNQPFALEIGSKNTELQTWPMAFWPDGSIKWMGCATTDLASMTKENQSPITINTVTQMNMDHQQCNMISESDNHYILDTGLMSVKIPKSGHELFNHMAVQDKKIVTKAMLEGFLEERSIEEGCQIIKKRSFVGVTKTVTVELAGPILAVIKMEGLHVLKGSGREMLPFTIRLKAYRNAGQLDITHTFLYDGQAEADFIGGIGLSIYQNMSDDLHRRQVKFAGDEGMFSEYCQHLSTRTPDYLEHYEDQIEGRTLNIPSCEDWIMDMAVWNHYRLVQASSKGYQVEKTTQDDCAYIQADHGKRSMGSCYVGDENKGLLMGIKDFWQRCPSSMEVKDLASDLAKMTMWFWSPEAAAMDMRHYDTTTHVVSSYEGSYELDSTPYGIGNTHEMVLELFSNKQDDRALYMRAKEIQNPPRLICDLKRYQSTNVLGVYGLADSSTPLKSWIEDQLKAITDFYQQEIDQRDWYGFWHYGDFMHTYDQVRHKWRYDLGGYAWQNTELAPNMWLWLSFLRTGEPSLFRMAEAMTRHTSEVDVYHLGDYKGLGSRHNVIHWGCGAKEARIAMAGLHRYYYYLTADERIRDIIDEVVDADFSTLNKDPMREYYPKDQFDTHARSGPDWAAYSSNWFTCYERTGDKTYLDKLMTGVDSLYHMPYKMLSGSCFGYSPSTGKLHYMGEDTYGYHLAICMGGPQVWMEMADQLPDDRLREMLIEFGEFYYLSHEEKQAQTCPEISSNWDWPMFATGIAAYAVKNEPNLELAQKIWHLLLTDEQLRCVGLPVMTEVVSKPYMVGERLEIPMITTNTMSQWSLNMIMCLELIGDYLEEAVSLEDII